MEHRLLEQGKTYSQLGWQGKAGLTIFLQFLSYANLGE